MSNPFRCNNSYVGALLTDYYQITMAYAYWKLGKHNDPSVFDLLFRKNPFNGEFTVFAGLGSAMRYLQEFRFSDDDIAYLKSIMLNQRDDLDSAFFDWLKNTTLRDVKVYAVDEGTVSFPYVPLLRVEGPLAICQLLETTLLNLVNFASLVTTNAVRYRLAAGPDKRLLEFGLRRAQGPDGAMAASRYAYLGGFDATSNVKASQVFNIKPSGTHAHSFITSFRSTSDLKSTLLFNKNTNRAENFLEAVLQKKKQLSIRESHEGELAAFVGYAIAWPNSFLALVDTYNTLKSGVPNYVTVALTLIQFGYAPLGVRLDSGDLAYLSKEARTYISTVSQRMNEPKLSQTFIVASNEIDESTLLSFNQQEHEIDAFGIGTNLITCQNQTSLGGIYKLVMINNLPCLKVSQDISKISIPGRKDTYRFFDAQNRPLLDLMCESTQPPPQVGDKIMCRHPFQETMRTFVIPHKIQLLHKLVWDGGLVLDLPHQEHIRSYIQSQITSLRKDHIRFLNPTPYKVSLSERLYHTFHTLWLAESSVSCIQ